MAETDWDAALARLGPAVVDCSIRSTDGRFHTPGVVVPDGMITAWIGLASNAAELPDVMAIELRQGERTWKAAIGAFRWDWALGGLYVDQPWAGPRAEIRLSTTIEDHEEIAIVDMRDGRPAIVAMGSIAETFLDFSKERPWERCSIAFALVDQSFERSGALVMDAAGRLAGLVEADGKALRTAVGVIPAERMERVGVSQLLASFVKAAPEEAVRLFEKNGAALAADPWALCATGAAFESMKSLKAARQLWAKALAIEPDNPWPLQQLSRTAPEERA